MSAIAQIKLSSILDGVVKTTDAAIGVDKTFDPEGFDSGVARWVDRSASTTNPDAVAIGFPSLTLSVRPPSKSSRIFKVTVKLALPTLEQTSASTATGIQPAPTKAYDCTFVGDFMLPERSTSTERAALLNYVASLFAATITASDGVPSDSTGSPLISAIQSFERPY